jgi:Cd2+/Zn2+-exporting ATPase
MISALATAARNGVLIRGGRYLEAAARIDAFAFDKTGTLTQGRLRVAEVIPLHASCEGEVLHLAAALEACCKHPIANAIAVRARDHGEIPPAEEVQILRGRGVTGTVHGIGSWIGSPRYCEERALFWKKGAQAELNRIITRCENSGMTVVVAGQNDKAIGVILLTDSPRSEARTMLIQLRERGVAHTTLVTGDSTSAAHALSAALPIDDVRANLLPEEKVSAVEELLSKYRCVAMVGDGINDAPALARATLGIAMGSGSATAMETADVTLIDNNLSRIPWLMEHSRLTMNIIRQNAVVAILLKTAFIALATFGFTSLWLAVTADIGTLILLVANSLRLLRARTMTTDTNVKTVISLPTCSCCGSIDIAKKRLSEESHTWKETTPKQDCCAHKQVHVHGSGCGHAAIPNLARE